VHISYGSAPTIPAYQVPEDLIGTVSFLTSAAAAFITGQTLNVDRVRS
jgi:NAD(P)-dependent dehydrogenase (short-subunit alcohol dehydrogenase family)